MPITRRSLLQGIAALGAGLILPPTLAESAEASRRYWALDRTMVPSRVWDFHFRGPEYTHGAWLDGYAVRQGTTEMFGLRIDMVALHTPIYESDPLQWWLNRLPGTNTIGHVIVE